MDEISKRLNLCTELKTDADLNWALKLTHNAFTLFAMMNYPYKTNFLTELPPNRVNVSCNLSIESDPLFGTCHLCIILLRSYGIKFEHE
ncbi:unnamed protein product [Protopolystoma xenopodis]|uniref:Uncharacterized protein n=1 Tax=Protopolystoma xenopodis TaxID=117903 RepID=A0A3S5BWP2_9PLAT|nr:unnamed protein product [Protopolystoma xenopodis]